MALAITHPFVSTVPDGADTGVARPSDWNADHAISGLGTGVETALGVNIGSAGAPVLFNGELGTPTSGVATNLTGTAAGLTAGTAAAVAVGGITGLGTGVATALAVNVGLAGAFTTNNAVNAFTAAQSIAAGTLTTDVKTLNLSATWNAAGVTFTGIKFNATDTASAAGSLLMDLQVGGVSKFKVIKSGSVLLSSTGQTHVLQPSASSLRLLNSTETAWMPFTALNLGVVAAGYYSFGSSTNPESADLYLYRDAANTLAQRNSTNAQESRVYGTYTSASSYHYVAVKTAKTTLTATAGATITATNLIPDGAFLIGVTTRVNTTCTTATGYTVGDGSDVDLWGVASAVSSGTATKSSDFTAAAACGLYIAAKSVVITATGGNFDGTGAIEVVAHYLTTEAD